MASPFDNIKLSNSSRLLQDIRTPNRQVSILQDLDSTKTVTFMLNPDSVDEVNQPVQSTIPTAGNFHVYRWMNAPTLWTISGYAGLDGKNLQEQLENFMGVFKARWHYPYLGPDKQVRIDDISLPKRAAQSPFGIYYQIKMQELTPKLNTALISQIIPTRITPGFVSPNTISQSQILASTSIGAVPVLPNWTNMDQAALFIYQQHLSSIDASTLAKDMRTINSVSPEPWPPGQPFNTQLGQIVQDLLFPIALGNGS